jgi:pimeloyl-ACP methyl ester carboxylesterase
LTLVLLHPLGADRRVWDPVLPLLDRDVMAVDLPGFGDAPALPGESVTPIELATALRDRLPAEFDVAGISLGGWVALELALAGWARSVTAIAPAGLWEQPLTPKRSTARLAARATRPLLPRVLRSERGRRAALLGTVARPERVPYEDALRLVRSYADAPGFEAANRGMRAGRFMGLDEIHVPLTLAWCEHDRLVSRPSRVPSTAREHFLRGCGHLPTWDDPSAVARVLMA